MAPTIEQMGDYISSEETIKSIQKEAEDVQEVADSISELSKAEATPKEMYEKLQDMGVCYIEKLPLKQVDAYEQTEDHFDYVLFALNPKVSEELDISIVEKLLSEANLAEIFGERIVRIGEEEVALDREFIQEVAQQEIELIGTSSPGESRRRYLEIYKKRPLYTYLGDDLDGVKIGFIAGAKIDPDGDLAELIENTKKYSKSALKTRERLVERMEGQWNYIEDRDIRKLTEVFSNLRKEGYIPTLNFDIEMCGTGRMRIGTPQVEALSNEEPLSLIETGSYCVGEDFPGIDTEWGSFKNPLLGNERMYFIKVYQPGEDNFEQNIIEQYCEPVFVEYVKKLAQDIKGRKAEAGPMVRIAKLNPVNDNRG
jgi:hypothetical protein